MVTEKENSVKIVKTGRLNRVLIMKMRWEGDILSLAKTLAVVKFGLSFASLLNRLNGLIVACNLDLFLYFFTYSRLHMDFF